MLFFVVPPKEVACLPWDNGRGGRGSLGYTNYTILCYGTMNPTGTVKWSTTGGAQLRQGINVNTVVSIHVDHVKCSPKPLQHSATLSLTSVCTRR